MLIYCNSSSSLAFAGSYTDYLEYRRDDAQYKKEEAALAKRELVAASSAASNSSKTSKKVEAKVVEAKAVSASPAPAAAVAAPGSKLNYNERKEFNKLEKEIEKLGVQIGDFEDKLAAASSAGQGYSALAELTEKMNALIMSREIKEQRWMELADNDA
jgi:ABC transport system ATP-binding/permease protein